ncbi:hypothetical protein DPMN_036603 [Dreissena polymorpha]|uniref:Uncharacterized protein n=1 Tax=Dreissena polymorpha TaxID=45954 RepID=A0A9D4MCT8_DREPO|nr:hypothetical protein DPMN_036603 [Dreissena polymorpha]
MDLGLAPSPWMDHIPRRAGFEPGIVNTPRRMGVEKSTVLLMESSSISRSGECHALT